MLFLPALFMPLKVT